MLGVAWWWSLEVAGVAWRGGWWWRWWSVWCGGWWVRWLGVVRRGCRSRRAGGGGCGWGPAGGWKAAREWWASRLGLAAPLPRSALACWPWGASRPPLPPPPPASSSSSDSDRPPPPRAGVAERQARARPVCHPVPATRLRCAGMTRPSSRRRRCTSAASGRVCAGGTAAYRRRWRRRLIRWGRA